MRIDTTFLRSKVARRIFILFICCALLPILVLILLYYGHFTKQLNVRSQRQLHQTSKDIGMYINERLLFLEAEMKMVSSRIGPTRRVDFSIPAEDLDIDLKQYFKGLVFINNNGTSRPVFGRIQNIPVLTQPEKQHLQSSKTVVSTMHLPDHSSLIFMSMARDPRQPRRGFLLGEINPSYLWGVGDENPWMAAAELCIFDHSHNILFSTLPPPLSFPEDVVQAMDSNVSGQFEWEHEKNHYMAGYWTLFLKARYYTPKWTVVLSESKEDVLAPTATFKKLFPLIILMTILVVILLGIIQIRRNLIPLEKLQEATRRIAKRKFDSRVTIKTGDEFEELAASFNTMTDRLGKQFKTLTTITEIDRSILSALDTDKIIEVVLNRMHDIFPSDCVSVTLFNLSNQGAGLTYIRGKDTEIEKKMESIIPRAEEIKKIYNNPEFYIKKMNHTTPHYFEQLATRGMKSFIVFPLFINQILSGIIILGYQKKPSYNQEDIAQARQVADQVAVALSNTRLVEELEQLHLGTLTALARSIDAKSRWTAGHSERVTKLALKIGSAFGLSPKELEVLRRGGLLHDIGKIGVPASILDKSGKLTDIEDRFVREHVRWGVHILEPIAAFADIIPTILHHHEQLDGLGYPAGLSGEAICLNARILAVADAFDALTSHRPYRVAVGRERAIKIIKQGAGNKFDPKIVQAFLVVIQQDQKNYEDNDSYLEMEEYL
jgi:putative nucleotidyltransferase with HDIG domain